LKDIDDVPPGAVGLPPVDDDVRAVVGLLVARAQCAVALLDGQVALLVERQGVQRHPGRGRSPWRQQPAVRRVRGREHPGVALLPSLD
jgi:hypothetical protein